MAPSYPTIDILWNPDFNNFILQTQVSNEEDAIKVAELTAKMLRARDILFAGNTPTSP